MRALLTVALGGTLVPGCGGEGSMGQDAIESESLEDIDTVEPTDNPELNRYSGDNAAVGQNPEGPDGTVTLFDEYGQPRLWHYEVIDGYAVAEGDIVLGTLDEIALMEKGLIRTDRPWPKRELVYSLNSNLTPTQKTRITSAMTAWTNATGAKFRVKKTNEVAYAEFKQVAGVCQSQVGRTGNQQTISLDATGCGTAAIIHEIGHAFGLEHEHTRDGRDDTVKYYPARVQTGKSSNFDINKQAYHTKVGSFDFDSIMMYDSYAFSALNNGSTPCTRNDVDCLPTLTRKTDDSTWTNKTVLSAGDIKAFRTLYPTFELPTVTTNLALYTDVRQFANSTTNKDRFCVDYGYTKADTTETIATRPPGTAVASWDAATSKWVGSTLSLTTTIYTKIVCKF
jgi:hypothetical protein